MKRFFSVLSLLFIIGTALVISDKYFVKSSAQTALNSTIEPVSINPEQASFVNLEVDEPLAKLEF